MEDGCIPKDLLYVEVVTGKRSTGRPQLRYKDTCKRHLTALGINADMTWEAAAADGSTLQTGSAQGSLSLQREHDAEGRGEKVTQEDSAP